MKKNIQIQERDRWILSGMYWQRWLSTEQIRRLYFPVRTYRTAQACLTRLKDGGLVLRRERQNPGRYTKGKLWTLTRRGSDAVAESSGLAFRKYRDPDRSPEFREHTIMGNELYVRVVAHGTEKQIKDRITSMDWKWSSQASCLTWSDKANSKPYENRRIYPDVTIETRTEKLWLEIDRSTKTLERVRRNIEAYQEYGRWLYKRGYDGPKPKLLYVVLSPARRNNVMEQARAVSEQCKRERLNFEITVGAMTLAEAEVSLRNQIFADGATEPERESELPPKTDKCVSVKLAETGAVLNKVWGDYQKLEKDHKQLQGALRAEQAENEKLRQTVQERDKLIQDYRKEVGLMNKQILWVGEKWKRRRQFWERIGEQKSLAKVLLPSRG